MFSMEGSNLQVADRKMLVALFGRRSSRRDGMV
jgi:hypothetical protein